jgi:hypothetical protein
VGVSQLAEALRQENFTGTITSILPYQFRPWLPPNESPALCILGRYAKLIHSRCQCAAGVDRFRIKGFVHCRRGFGSKPLLLYQASTCFVLSPTCEGAVYSLSKCNISVHFFHLAILSSKRKAKFNFHIRTARPPWGRSTALPDDVDHSLRQQIMSIWGIGNSVVIQIQTGHTTKSLPHKHRKKKDLLQCFP